MDDMKNRFKIFISYVNPKCLLVFIHGLKWITERGSSIPQSDKNLMRYGATGQKHGTPVELGKGHLDMNLV